MIGIFSGEATLSKLFYLPSEMGSNLKGKNLSLRKQILPFRVVHFLEELGVQ